MALEYPEIVKISGQLQDVLPGKKIVDIDLSDHCDQLINKGYVNLHKRDIVGLVISSITNWGEYIFIHFESDMNLVLGHLSGKILYHKSHSDVPQKYMILFTLSGNHFLSLHTNSLGFAYALTDEELKKHKIFGVRGLEPLSDDFTYDYFSKVLSKNKRKLVKELQMLYGYLTGFQNGYFQDILFKAQILPLRRISSLDEEENHLLYDSIRDVTAKAVELGGSKEERDIYNKPGNYLRIMGEKQKNKPCPICGGTIRTKIILGSNSYYCANCQK